MEGRTAAFNWMSLPVTVDDECEDDERLDERVAHVIDLMRHCPCSLSTLYLYIVWTKHSCSVGHKTFPRGGAERIVPGDIWTLDTKRSNFARVSDSASTTLCLQ